MIGGLIKKEDISVHKHSTSKLELHLPSSREGSDLHGTLLIIETDGFEGLYDLVVVLALEGLVSEHEVNDRLLSIDGLEIVLNEDSLEDISGGETIELTVADSSHEGRLTSTIGSAQTVTLSTGKTELSVVEQNHTTISKGELAVAKLFSFLGVNLSDLNSTLGVLLNKEGVEGAVDLSSLGGGNEGLEDGGHLGPGSVVVVTDVIEGHAEVCKVVEGDGVEQGESLSVDLANNLLDGSNGVVKSTAGLNLIGLDNNVLISTTNTDEGGLGLGGNIAKLRVGSDGNGTVQSREKLGQELLSVDGVLNQLAHVINDNGSLTEDVLGRLTKSTLEDGSHDGK
jgi:hypothetical protein